MHHVRHCDWRAPRTRPVPVVSKLARAPSRPGECFQPRYSYQGVTGATPRAPAPASGVSTRHSCCARTFRHPPIAQHHPSPAIQETAPRRVQSVYFSLASTTFWTTMSSTTFWALAPCPAVSAAGFRVRHTHLVLRPQLATHGSQCATPTHGSQVDTRCCFKVASVSWPVLQNLMSRSGP